MNNTFFTLHDRDGSARIFIIILLLIGVGLVLWLGADLFQGERSPQDDGQTGTTTDEEQNGDDAELSHTESTIRLDGDDVLSIDEFPDAIQVSEDATFGGSERIDDAILSPDGELIAIAVSGAAHSFGWVYELQTDELKPVAFQYGGGVEIEEWTDATTVVFTLSTPEPDTETKTVDVNNLPAYPRVGDQE